MLKNILKAIKTFEEDGFDYLYVHEVKKKVLIKHVYLKLRGDHNKVTLNYKSSSS